QQLQGRQRIRRSNLERAHSLAPVMVRLEMNLIEGNLGRRWTDPERTGSGPLTRDEPRSSALRPRSEEFGAAVPRLDLHHGFLHGTRTRDRWCGKGDLSMNAAALGEEKRHAEARMQR